MNFSPGIPWKPDPKVRLGKDKIEVVYAHTAHDRDLDETSSSLTIVQINDSLSVFTDYNTFRLDSVTVMLDTIHTTAEEHFNLTKLYVPLNSMRSLPLVINLNNGKLKEYNPDYFISNAYIEDIPEMEWHLSDETRDINGHPCMKATLDFRGRHWTAWYATDINLPYGPWKFAALPGLIMEIADDSGDHRFNVVSINTATDNLIILPAPKLSVISREEMLKRQHRMYKEGGKSQALKALTVSGGNNNAPLRNYFYVPLELE